VNADVLTSPVEANGGSGAVAPHPASPDDPALRRSAPTGRSRHPDPEVWRALFDQVRRSDLSGQLHSIAFEVQDGRVVLSGQLLHRRDIARLICLAWNVAGVAAVTDRLHYCGEPLDLRSETRCSQAAEVPV